MPVDRMNSTLQENLITLLAHDDTQGKLIAQMVNVDLFEGDYRLIAERCVTYWQQHGSAPKVHTPDLVAEILQDQHDRRNPNVRRILTAMLELSEQINSAFVLDQLQRFHRLQKLKDVIIKSAERLNSAEDLAITDVEQMWHEILHVRDPSFRPGIWLHDVDRLLAFLESREREFDVGIDRLDWANAVPTRGCVMLFLGGAGKGKTWFLVHCGKRAFLQRKRVCHITLELSEELVLQRYYQALYSLPRRDYGDEHETTVLQFDEKRRLNGFDKVHIEPDFTFQSAAIRDELQVRIDWTGTRFRNVIIKQFPGKQLTIRMLRAYLDQLELLVGFVPDLLIIDYLKEMATDLQHYRFALDNNLAELRGLGVERNIAVVTAQQLSKAGTEATTAGAHNVAEAYGLIGTADIVLTMSCTKPEYRHGLARIFVDKNREDEDKYGVLIKQDYRGGEFVLQSMPLRKEYYDLMQQEQEASEEKEIKADDEDNDEDAD